MEGLLLAWVGFQLMRNAITVLLTLEAVDFGGSLAVASRGLFSTGVSTDLSVTYLSSGGQVGDVIKAIATCEKCKQDKKPNPNFKGSDKPIVGKSLAYTSIQFTNAKGELAARGSHTK